VGERRGRGCGVEGEKYALKAETHSAALSWVESLKTLLPDAKAHAAELSLMEQEQVHQQALLVEEKGVQLSNQLSNYSDASTCSHDAACRTTGDPTVLS
jgi:hypothetical protein